MENSECGGGEASVRKALARAEAFDMSDVMERYRQNTRLPEEVLREHEREIKRFLALSSVYPGAYGMRGPLDELWHTFIIFTSLYARFCQSLGGSFIHHLPEKAREQTPDEATGIKQSERSDARGAAGEIAKGSYLKFLEDYERFVGDKAPAHLWPRPGGGVMSPSCDNCGNFCYQTCAAMPIKLNVKRY